MLKDDSSFYWSENYPQSRYCVAFAVKAENKRTRGVKLRFPESLDGVPEDFRFEYSNDGIIWRKAPCALIKGFRASEYKTYDFPFERETEAKYVRLVATKLGRLGVTELYALRIERFAAY